jgi:signal transduction histidine kinase
MDALLSGLLRLSRLGGAALDVKAVDARAVLRGALKAMDFTISQAGASVRIEEPFAPCMADANLLNQAFSNVLDNALKYRDPARRLTIVVSCDCTDGDPVYCIADNGIGMEQRYCDTVFELFHRLDPDAAEGDGLGLTIVRKSVERLNGAVWAVSRPGAGTRMHIRLPAVRDEGVHYSPQEELCNGK